MSEFEDIINNANGNSRQEKKPFDKEAWIKRVQEERKTAYETMDRVAQEIVKDTDKFKTYLDVQGRLDKYSVGNALLITDKMPNATQLKDYSDWKEIGASIKSGQKHIIILEPGDQYTRANGQTATSYNPKKVFDISQTTARPLVKQNIDDKTKLTALVTDCPVDPKIVDSISNSNRLAEWNKEDNVLYISKTDDIQKAFREVATELARIGMEESNNPELDNFKCKCTAYMLCKKYGIDVSSIDINTIPDSLKNMSSSEIR
ncbi:MAG: hypothetical protein IJO57_01050, partial [Bacilli bacterium]|nr:hypothetical protein [Bacilli bacterium]